MVFQGATIYYHTGNLDDFTAWCLPIQICLKHVMRWQHPHVDEVVEWLLFLSNYARE